MINNYSPHMLKTYQNCPKKFYFQFIEHINMPKSSSPFEKGKKIHALANYNLQGIKIDKLENTLTDTEKNIWNLLLGNEYFNKECYKSEFSLSCKINKFWIGGRIDAIVRDFNRYYILDYKTGSEPQNAQYDFQTIIYLLCIDKYLKNYETLSFVYINLKDNKNLVINFDNNIKQEYEEKIIKTCTLIDKDKVFKCNKEHCNTCEYKKICK